MWKILHLLSIGAAVACFLLGCSNPRSRANAYAEAWRTVSLEHQSAALQGVILRGMTRNAVFVALGPPSRISWSGDGDERRELWTYANLESVEIPYTSPGKTLGEPGLLILRRDTPLYIGEPEQLQVLFENGGVTDWKIF